MKISFTINMANGKEITVSAEKVLALLGQSCKVVDASMSVKSNNGELIATTTDEEEYTGITTDAKMNDKLFFLSYSELPSSENSCITSRLYAGDSGTESDEPIALVASPIRDTKDESRKVVYLDDDLAVAEHIQYPPFCGTEKEFLQRDRKSKLSTLTT